MHEVTLNNIGGGIAPALFQEYHERVMENIADAHTPASAKRELTIKLVYTPNEQRDYAEVAISATVKLAADKPHQAPVHLHLDGERLVARQIDEHQRSLGLETPEE